MPALGWVRLSKKQSFVEISSTTFSEYKKWGCVYHSYIHIYTHTNMSIININTTYKKPSAEKVMPLSVLDTKKN